MHFDTFCLSQDFYAPNFEEVDRAYWFRIVRACVRPCILSSKTCMLGFWNFIYGFHMKKYLTHIFFLSELSPFLELCPFEKTRMKSDACHILWTMHARVLKFHIRIPRGKIADPYFFFLSRVISLSGVMLFWKNQNEILSARYLKKYLSWGLETWSADRGCWVDYLIKFIKKIILFYRRYGPLKIWAF